MMKRLAIDFFLKNVSDQTLSLDVFYSKPMQNVQLLAFLYNYCAKSQINGENIFDTIGAFFYQIFIKLVGNKNRG